MKALAFALLAGAVVSFMSPAADRVLTLALGGAVLVVVLGWLARQLAGELRLRRLYNQPAEPTVSPELLARIAKVGQRVSKLERDLDRPLPGGEAA